MTEHELLATVQARCDELGLYHHHRVDSRKDTKDTRGFPDLVIAGPLGVIFAELKSNNGTLQPEQRRWGSKLRASGQVWTIWRPETLHAGIIDRMLKSIAMKG